MKETAAADSDEVITIHVTTAEYNGLSSEIYGNGIPHSEDIGINITWCNLRSHG